jgi:hypothetical protein
MRSVFMIRCSKHSGLLPDKPLKLAAAGLSQSFGFSSTRSW